MRSMGKYTGDIEQLFLGVDIGGLMVGHFHSSE